MSKKGKIISILIAMFIIGAIASWIIVTYMVNNGYTKTESETEDTFYNQLEELEMLEELEDTNDKTESDEISFLQSIRNIFIQTASAEDTRTQLVLKKSTNKLLEKYFILSQLDINKMPKEVFTYWRKNWKEFPQVLNSYDYLNKTFTLKKYIELKKEYAWKIFYEETINKELITIIENYFKNKKTVTNITFLPFDIATDENFKFMIEGLKNHKFLVSNSKKLGKKLGFDYRLTLAAILTEQFRYAGTYRWYVKSYLTKTPFIFSMTKFSYWVWGIKELTWTKIVEDAKIYGYENVFDWEKADIFKNFSRKSLLQQSYWETIYPNILIKNIISRWDKAGFSIKNKPWIILTLYNFWNSSNKKPHWNPKIGGAVIKLNEQDNRSYTFWWLWESLYYYIKVYWLYK